MGIHIDEFKFVGLIIHLHILLASSLVQEPIYN